MSDQQRRAVPVGERHASWLELFFDLIFVVAVSELGGLIEHRPVTAAKVVRFIALFIPIWWAWIGAAFYADRFGIDDAIHRVLTAAQMLGVAILAVTVHQGEENGLAPFALSYAAVRAILVLQYLRAGRRFPAATRLTRRYAVGFALAAGGWAISALILPPMRYVVWVVALLVDFATPLSSRRLHATVPLDTSHLPERIGLFTLIVMGESVLAVVSGVASKPIELSAAVTGSLGLAIAFSIWWIYFDNIDASVIKRTMLAGQIWVYTHLPLVMGLTAAGIGTELAITHHPLASPFGPERWLLGVALAVCLVAIAILDLSSRTDLRAVWRETSAVARVAAAVVALVITAVGSRLSSLAFVALMAVLCWTQVGVDALLGRTTSGKA